MADPPRPRRASLAKGLRYIFVGFISLGFAVGPMLPVWLTNPDVPDDPLDADPDRPRPADSTVGPAGSIGSTGRTSRAGPEPPRLAPERPLAPRPFSYRPGLALSGAEEAVWVQLVRNLRPAVGRDWEVPE